MILRLVSGSSTSARRSRKRSVASTYTKFASIWFWNTSMTCSDSPLRISPWFTCTHTRFFPMALMSSAATTEESTPPDSASSTFLSPTCSRMAATCSSMNACASSGVVMRSMSSGRTFSSIETSSVSVRLFRWRNYSVQGQGTTEPALRFGGELRSSVQDFAIGRVLRNRCVQDFAIGRV